MASKSSKSNCPVTLGQVDLAKYQKVDGNWRALGLAAPARRALVDAKLLKLADLAKIKLEDLSKLHGMGPKAISALKSAGAKFKK